MNDYDHPSYRHYGSGSNPPSGQTPPSPRKHASPSRPERTGSRPVPRRTGGAAEHDYSVPHAPRRRRTTPVDYAAAYDIPPQEQTAFDPVDTEPEIMGEIDYPAVQEALPDEPADVTAPDAAESFPAPDAYAESESASQSSFGPEPVRLGEEPEDDAYDGGQFMPGSSAASDDGYDGEEDEYDDDVPYYDLQRHDSGHRRGAPRARKSPLSRLSRKTRTIITVILLFIVANLIWISVWLLGSFSLVGGKLIPLDTTELDLRDKGIGTVLGVSRLESLERLDLRGNNISIRQYKKLAKKLPSCEIIWDVPIASSVSVSNIVSDADISSSSGVKISRLKKAVPYMTALERLDVSDCGLDEDQLYELDSSFENVDLIWSTDILGQQLPTDAKEITIGTATVEDLENVAGKIRYFDSLERLDLVGSGLSESQLYDFAVRHPDAKCSWNVEVCGQTFTSEALELRLSPTAEAPLNDLTVLRSFYRLQALYITGGDIDDLSPLSSKLTLRILALDNCGISDLSPLKPLNGLVYLELNGNDIENLDALSDMDKLEELHLNSNNISDITPLSGLASLRLLNVQDNRLETVAGFGDVPVLETLSLRKNNLSDAQAVSSLRGISTLKMLDLQQNPFKNKVQAEIIAQFEESLPECTLYIWK